MRVYLKNLVAAAALVLLGAASSAQALTLHQGESVVLNADFTGANPPPPYLGAMILQFVFSGGDPGDQFAADIYGDLNATGTLIGTLNNIVGPFGNITGFASEMLDGVYSIRLSAAVGDFNVDNAWFEARNSRSGGPVDVTIPAAINVPEPTSLALFGTVAGVAALRRRRRKPA
jgi:PEP-CTERM motif-containing protein